MAMPWCLGIRNTDTVNQLLFVINLFRNLPETNWFTMTSFCNQEFMEYIIPKSFEDFLPRNFCGEILANLTKISHMWIKVGVRHAFHSSLMLMMIHQSQVDNWLTRTVTKGTTYQWLKHFEFFNICAMIWDKFVHIFQVLVNKTKEMFFPRPEGLDTSCGTMSHHWWPRYHQITYRLILKQHLVAEYCRGAKFV